MTEFNTRQQAFGHDLFSTGIAENFVNFYKTYPISDQAMPLLDKFAQEMLYAYDPPPTEACVSDRSEQPSSSPASSLSPSVESSGCIHFQQIVVFTLLSFVIVVLI